MAKCDIYIKGMHCRSCEILVEDELKKISGVTSAYVNHKKGLATISFQSDLQEADIIKAVENAGYTYGRDSEEKRKFISTDINAYRELGIGAVIAVALFLIARNLGLFNLSSNLSGNYSSLPVVFLIGITAGVSTCMALVGGLILGASANYAKIHPESTGLQKFIPHLYFNLGRIISYFLLGGVIGLLGSVFQLSSSLLGILTIAVGMVMLLLGGQLIDIFPVLKNYSFTIPKGIARFVGLDHQNPAIMGALTFFLPCGFTQAMQLYAMSTGSALSGALTMGVFALGTAPGLLSVGGLSAVVKGRSSRLFFKTAGLVVIFLSLFNISNGLNLLGLNPLISLTGTPVNEAKAGNITDPAVTLENGVQVVRMRQVSNGYVPNKFTVKKGIPVRWVIDSVDSNTCAASIVSQQLGIRKSLQAGNNIIEFTPDTVGNVRFSCSMGMYTGIISVIE